MPAISSQPYHHGDLRSRLMAAALAALAHSAPAEISLRALARDIGVSHNAPYMHFADKEALWVAIADAGFDLLAEKIAVAIAPLDDPLERLSVGCTAYVRFAEDHREHALVMFRANPAATPRHLSPRGTVAFELLVREVASAMAADALAPASPVSTAARFWAVIHGQAMLRIQFHGVPDVAELILPAEETGSVVAALARGLRRAD